MKIYYVPLFKYMCRVQSASNSLKCNVKRTEVSAKRQKHEFPAEIHRTKDGSMEKFGW